MTQSTFEILILLTGAAVLGYILGWYMRKIFVGDLFSYEDVHADYQDKYQNVVHEDRNDGEKVKEKAERAQVRVTETVVINDPDPVDSPRGQVSEPVITEVQDAGVLPGQTAYVPGPDKHNLKIVEGIGPKIQELLNSHNIMTLSDLSNTQEGRLREILVEAGERYRIHDPSTWPEQARLADEGKVEELNEYQNFLSGGKLVK